MRNDLFPDNRLYLAAFAVLLASIALVSIGMAGTLLAVGDDVNSIRLILLNDYEITQ